MKRKYDHREGVARCQAVSKRTKKRCSNDATHQLKGQALCAQHANMTLEKKR